MIRTRFAAIAASLALLACTQSVAASVIDVAKTPWCGCCAVWVERMRAAGFELAVRNVDDLNPVADKAGVPRNLRGCHTAKVDGYVIEGHVPAADIRRLLKERPDAVGLSVPGMPIGSPGMENGTRVDRYQVVLIMRDGRHRVWSVHGGTS
ncbi:DUF411 domain-containing protein [Erythrobacter insulae]|uniref:DUF411 domain-containing protein n=1 Tax=Erythrobacter insulae TaxID=2584124 RepID=A0A547PEC2_9SPHN|nr:DUF411 domain-containing protein [Erythrobacter insulae]TRD12492.1 DUF411 domain-containing protein [Erythrobacter insulae]